MSSTTNIVGSASGQQLQFVEESEEGIYMRKRKDIATQLKQGFKRYRWLIIVVIFVIFIIVVAVSINNGIKSAQYVAIKAKNGVVASEEYRCSNIGVDIMKRGGNAVDAAIATAICVGALSSYASGIGGGGFMVVYNPSTKGSSSFDFRDSAPSSAFPTMFVGKPGASTEGGLSVAIPGELRGFEAAHAKYGVMEWKELFTPSIELLRNGFAVSEFLEFRLEAIKDLVLSDPLWGAIYAPDGKLVAKGDVVSNPSLADTLDKIANQGAAAFYTGEIAQDLVNEINARGGNVTMQDFADYKAKERRPITSYYHGKKVITSGAPSSGPVLLAILNILERYEISTVGLSTDTYQALVEAFKFGFGQRSFLGDPDFANVTSDITRMVSKDWASNIRRNISMTETFLPTHYGSNYDIKEAPGTAHISVIDKNGMACSLTSTVNLPWGSKIMTTRGVVLNNQMDDFSTPGQDNAYGLKPSPANFIAPGKRPLSSCTPTIVLRDEEVEFVVGASGGSRIITSTLQVLLHALDLDKEIMEAVQAPRCHHQLYPNTLELEYEFTTSVRRALQSIGHEINWLDPGIYSSVVQAIKVKEGYYYGASDPRKKGQASGY